MFKLTENTASLSATNLSADNLNTQLSLIDIELPISPDFDWLGLLQTGVYWFLIFLILAGLVSLYLMLKTRHKAHNKQPVWLHFYLLRKQLSQLDISVGQIDKTELKNKDLKNTAVAFYAFTQRLFYVNNLLHKSASEDLQNLKTFSNLLAFSNQPVSRETLQTHLEMSRKWLNAHITLKALLAFYGQKEKSKSMKIQPHKKGRQ
ncbi:hypothetical protein JCM30760_00200 [Thiomicrorhabdus hydrogeniphila]